MALTRIDPRTAAPATAQPFAVIYARYSSHNQKEESIEQQVAEACEYARNNYFNVKAVYADRHITGKTDKRPEFQRMLRAAERGEFQIIISYKSNRIARNMLHALDYENRLEKLGIRIVYVKEEFGQTAAGRFALRTMMNVNQFYSENMSEDILRGMADNADECKVNSSLPLGYKKGLDGKYAINESEALVVREVFLRVSNNEPFVNIINDLNTRGIRTKKGNFWNRSSFHHMLNNERYTGVYQWTGVRVDGGIPAIIEKEMYNAVQQILQTKNNPRGRHRENGDYLLTGKLFCGRCKSPMVGISGTSGHGGNMYHYYICHSKRRHEGCSMKAVRRDWAEHTVAEAIREYLLRDDVIEWMADTVEAYMKKRQEQSGVEALKDQLAAVRKSIKNMTVAIEQGIITETTKSRLLELESEKATIESNILLESAALREFNRDQIITTLLSYRSQDTSNKKVQASLFKNFLVAAYLYDDHLLLVFNYTGRKNTVSIPFSPDPGIIDKDGPPGISDSSYKLPSPPPNFFEKKFGSKSFIFQEAALIQMDSRFFVQAFLILCVTAIKVHMPKV